MYASVLYELQEADFHEICRLSSEDVGIPVVKCDNKCQHQEKTRGCSPDYKSGGDQGSHPHLGDDQGLCSNLGSDQELRPDLGCAQELRPDLGGDSNPKGRSC